MKTTNLNANIMKYKNAEINKVDTKTVSVFLMNASLLMALMLSLTLLSSQNASAQMSGQEIMEKVYHNPSGDDVEGRLTMTLINRQGERRVRDLQQYTKDYGDVDRQDPFCYVVREHTIHEGIFKLQTPECRMQ